MMSERREERGIMLETPESSETKQTAFSQLCYSFCSYLDSFHLCPAFFFFKVKFVLSQQSVWVGIAELLAVLQAGGGSLWLCQQRTVLERLLPLSLPGHSGIALWSIKLLHKCSWCTSLACLWINGVQRGTF